MQEESQSFLGICFAFNARSKTSRGGITSRRKGTRSHWSNVQSRFSILFSIDHVRLNDYQSAGPDGEQMLMYDQPAYDPFWKAVQDLDTVVYMHPRIAPPHLQKELYDDRVALSMACLQFGVDVQRHTLGLCVNGVFDRFPGLKFIIGHMGEMIPAHLWRIGWFLGMR
jgi:Amidohydrolase